VLPTPFPYSSAPACALFYILATTHITHAHTHIPYMRTYTHIHAHTHTHQKLFSPSTQCPFAWLWFPNDDKVKEFGKRATTVRFIFDVFGEGPTYADVYKTVKALPRDRTHPYFGKDTTFKVIVHAFGRSIAKDDQKRIMDIYYDVGVEGTVNLKQPDQTFWILVDYTHSVCPHDPELPPLNVYFCRQVTAGANHDVSKLELKKRKYISTTSMSSDLSLLVANQALADSSKIIYDPFTGTGSILVAAAHFGAKTIGSDIDIRVLRGKGGVTILDNFDQYGFDRPLTLFRQDIGNPVFRRHGRGALPPVDAIVCDPPYGIRAGARETGLKRQKLENRAREEEEGGGRGEEEKMGEEDPKEKEGYQPHFPATRPVPVSKVINNLFSLALTAVKVDGRLCFWLPTYIESYHEGQIPRHPCFTLLSNSEDKVTTRWSRRLLTYVKHREAEPNESVEAFMIGAEESFKDFAAKVLNDPLRSDDRCAVPGGKTS